MNGCVVERLLPDHSEVYQTLRLRGLREHPAAFTSSFEEDQFRPLTAAIERLTPSPERAHDAFFGAWLSQSLVGVVGVQGRYRAKERHTATVVGTYVAREAGGLGVGGALMQALIGHARGCLALRQLDLTVTAGNTAALRLYQSVGFETWGVCPDAVQVDGVFADKLHMALRLR